MAHFVDLSVRVYMVRCADGSYYVGSTRKSLEERIGEHNAGLYDGYTATRRSVALVWSETIPNALDAIACERRLKGWSRAKKEALIRGDWPRIQSLAERRGGKPS